MPWAPQAQKALITSRLERREGAARPGAPWAEQRCKGGRSRSQKGQRDSFLCLPLLRDVINAEHISQGTQDSIVTWQVSVSHSPQSTSLMPPFFFIRFEQEQEALFESRWGDQQFQNVTGEVRVDLIEINHKISWHSAKVERVSGVQVTILPRPFPYGNEWVTITPKFANSKEERAKSYLREWKRSCKGVGLLLGSVLAAVLWATCSSPRVMEESAPSFLFWDDTVNLTICYVSLELRGKGTAIGRISGQSIVHLMYQTSKCLPVLAEQTEVWGFFSD